MQHPEVMKSPGTVDTGPDLIQPATNENLQVVVELALEQLRDLTRQRQEIAQKMTIIKRTINGLAFLYGGEFLPRPENDGSVERRRGITSACRAVLSRAEAPLSTREVHSILQGGFPNLFERPGDHYASIVTILNRLVKYGEADTFLRNGSRFWQGHQSANHRSAELSGA